MRKKFEYIPALLHTCVQIRRCTTPNQIQNHLRHRLYKSKKNIRTLPRHTVRFVLIPKHAAVYCSVQMFLQIVKQAIKNDFFTKWNSVYVQRIKNMVMSKFDAALNS